MRVADFPELSDLEANSSVAQVWEYAKEVFALGTAQIEQSQDLLQEEVQTLIDDREPGGKEWYRERVMAYQHGDSLVVINNRPGYSVIDETKQIVKHVSVVEEQPNGALLIKAARNDGSIIQLSVDEVAGLTAYLSRVKVAGTLITVQSLLPNQVAYDVVVEVDKSVLNETGQRVDGSADTPVFDTLEVFHQDIDFNDILYLSRATDALQEIEGVIDVQITAASYFDGTDWVAIDRKYASEAGYVRLDIDQSNLTII